MLDLLSIDWAFLAGLLLCLAPLGNVLCCCSGCTSCSSSAEQAKTVEVILSGFTTAVPPGTAGDCEAVWNNTFNLAYYADTGAIAGYDCTWRYLGPLSEYCVDHRAHILFAIKYNVGSNTTDLIVYCQFLKIGTDDGHVAFKYSQSGRVDCNNFPSTLFTHDAALDKAGTCVGTAGTCYAAFL